MLKFDNLLQLPCYKRYCWAKSFRSTDDHYSTGLKTVMCIEGCRLIVDIATILHLKRITLNMYLGNKVNFE